MQEKMTLLDFVATLLPDSSKSAQRAAIVQKRVSVNGYLCTKPQTLLSGKAKVKLLPKALPLPKDVFLLYEDSGLIVINKPCGLLSVEAGYEDKLTAHQVLKNHYRPGRVFVIHRLDRDVSGVMLFAKTATALSRYKALLKDRKISRRYVAIVDGVIEQESGQWSNYLKEDEEYNVHVLPEGSTDGVLATTHYKVLKRGKKHTLLSITLDTGRKNQIRVQTAHHGHPIVGDTKYGKGSPFISRLCLHAYQLTVPHPNTLKKMVFETPYPEEFATFLSLKEIF